MDELKIRTALDPKKEICHIVGITEVKSKTRNCQTEMCEFNMTNYNMFSNDFTLESNRGVALYISKLMEATPIYFNTYFNECVWVTIKLSNDEIILVGCVYRSPNSDSENNNAMLNLINEICARKITKILIMGDFNLPEIDWDFEHVINASVYPSEFLDTFNDCFLFQHVTQPTRARLGQNSNTLDLVITNREELVSEFKHEGPLGKSDHCVLRFKVNCEMDSDQSQTVKYLYDKGNYEEMRTEINTVNWDQEIQKNDKDIDRQWMYFKTVYNNIVAKYVPVRKTHLNDRQTVTGKKHKYNKDITCAVKRKHRLWQRFVETGDTLKYEQYRTARNLAKGLIRDFHRQVEKQIAKQVKTNPKKFWAHVNCKTKVRNDIPELVISTEQDGSVRKTSNVLERAEKMSEYFSSVYTQEPDDEINIESCELVLPKLSVMTVTEELVLKKLLNLNSSKSPGPDNIHPRVLKEIGKEICTPLTMLFNNSIEMAKIPDEWKLADVTAVHKKGEKSLSENYRPISLTSIVCKLEESIIRDRLIEHLKVNRLLSNKQFGFLKGRSATLQLLNVLDDWTKILDSGDLIDVIYTDFQKAFDSVPHRRLLLKIKSYGIDKNILKWIESFLTGRRQRVKIKGTVSSWSKVISGVPQGSVLGPILFVMYINDIVDKLCCGAYLYADDMKIYNRIQNVDDRIDLQRDVDTVVKWTEDWLLKLNIAKCKILTIGNHGIDTPNYYIDVNGVQHQLLNTSTEKDLGVIIDQSLNFDNHISEIIKKANKMTGLIKRSFTYLEYETFLLLYKSMVRSHLEYAQNVWSPYKVKHIEALEKVQRRATKIVPGLHKLSYTQRLKKLRLPTLAFRRVRGDMIETFKIINNIYDPEACPTLQHAAYLSTRGHGNKLFKMHSVKNIRKYSFSCRIVDVWNSLPAHVIQAPVLMHLKIDWIDTGSTRI
jgi:hypothetical protein